MMMIPRLVAVAAVLLLGNNCGEAFPSGPGSCNSPNPLGALHLVAVTGGGPLSDFGLELVIGGDVVSPDAPVVIETGMDLDIQLRSTAGIFRGFLIKLSKVAVNTVNTLTPAPDDADVSTSFLCDTLEAGSLAHTNNADKTSVGGVLRIDEPGSDFILEVTAVIRNGVSEPGSEWYLSSYTLNAVSVGETMPCPEPPDGGCSVCGAGMCVTNPDAIFMFPGQPAAPCGILQQGGFDGGVPLDVCPILPGLMEIGVCGCASSLPVVVVPTEAPVEPPTDAPVEPPTDAPGGPTPCPDVPDDGCSVCGAGMCVTAPDEVFMFPGQPAAPCGLLQQAGFDGDIPLATCPVLPTLPQIGVCGCMSMVPGAPTAPPVDPPTDAPVEAPTDAPVEAPTDAPVEAPTDAPVEAPTDAPVDPPTDAPVATTDPAPAPTMAPVAPPTMAPMAPPTSAPGGLPPTPFPIFVFTPSPISGGGGDDDDDAGGMPTSGKGKKGGKKGDGGSSGDDDDDDA